MTCIANGPPRAVDDQVVTGANAAVVADVLANDGGLRGQGLSVASFMQPANGRVVLNADATLTYAAHAGSTGSDRFAYTVPDGAGHTSTATVTVAVTPEVFPDAAGFAAALAANGVVLGQAPQQIAETAVLQHGATTVGVYREDASFGALPAYAGNNEICGSFTVTDVGAGVSSTVVIVSVPWGIPRTLGLHLVTPEGAGATVAVISISRFGPSGATLSHPPATFEFHTEVPGDLQFYRCPSGSCDPVPVTAGACARDRPGCYRIASITSAFVVFDQAHDCDLGSGTVKHVVCPYEDILMEHCYRCYHNAFEVVVCDGWSEDQVRAQCNSPVPLFSPSPNLK